MDLSALFLFTRAPIAASAHLHSHDPSCSDTHQTVQEKRTVLYYKGTFKCRELGLYCLRCLLLKAQPVEKELDVCQLNAAADFDLFPEPFQLFYP